MNRTLHVRISYVVYICILYVLDEKKENLVRNEIKNNDLTKISNLQKNSEALNMLISHMEQYYDESHIPSSHS